MRILLASLMLLASSLVWLAPTAVACDNGEHLLTPDYYTNACILCPTISLSSHCPPPSGGGGGCGFLCIVEGALDAVDATECEAVRRVFGSCGGGGGGGEGITIPPGPPTPPGAQPPGLPDFPPEPDEIPFIRDAHPPGPSGLVQWLYPCPPFLLGTCF